MGIKVWLDDEREAPKGWVRVFSFKQCIDLIQSGIVDEISLDHDLGLPEEELGNGYKVLEWLERKIAEDNWLWIPTISIHTANPVARKRMEMVVASIERMLNFH